MGHGIKPGGFFDSEAKCAELRLKAGHGVFQRRIFAWNKGLCHQGHLLSTETAIIRCFLPGSMYSLKHQALRPAVGGVTTMVGYFAVLLANRGEGK
ncbi:hypothetical protein SODG_000431 [Sodalis praecaptivus]